MSMNNTPNAERLHIGLFGRRNAGKSSLLNALTGQSLAVTSPIAGTTTDTVSKAMELLPLGPVLFIDTPGLDDAGQLGGLRVEKAKQALHKTDLALLVIDSTIGLTEEDREIEALILSHKIPTIYVYNKCDLPADTQGSTIRQCHPNSLSPEHVSNGSTDCLTSANMPTESLTRHPSHKPGQAAVTISTKTMENIPLLKETIIALATPLLSEKNTPIVSDLVQAGDVVILVVPIDKAAPKGRLILPQQQTIRELLDTGVHTMIVRDTELADTFLKLSIAPKLVITDSQAFKKVASIVPGHILLTSFSILMARHKGNFQEALAGVKALDTITNDSHILIAEGCTHHRQCGDIGTVKLPALIRRFCGCDPAFTFTSGTEFPTDLSDFDLVIHCGGCMLHDRQMQHRYKTAGQSGHLPITNYGLAISYMNGILERSIELLKEKNVCV